MPKYAQIEGGESKIVNYDVFYECPQKLVAAKMIKSQVLPSVVYFPSYGGFLPYNEWKCNNSSEVCFHRTNILSDSGEVGSFL